MAHQKHDATLRTLLVSVAAGNELAFAQFYDASVGLVYGIALRILRDTQETEDVVSHVYLQVWQQAARFRAERGTPRAWLANIARSRALDQLRKRDRAQCHEDSASLADISRFDRGDLADWLTELEQGSALHKAMSSLSEEQRRMIALAYFRGLSHQEISVQTGTPLGSVKAHLRRGSAVLRAALENSAEWP